MERAERELATILAALRHWQRVGMNSGGAEADIATNGDTVKALSGKEIDSLCERLNSEGLGGRDADRRPQVAIVLEGGLVQHVVASVPVSVSTIDYDTEGCDEDEVTKVPQDDGKKADAVCGKPLVEVLPERAGELSRLATRAEKRKLAQLGRSEGMER